jgi:dCTP deaminase
MILRTERIAKLLEEGEIEDTHDPLVISPQPDLEKLRKSGSASIDLTLGTWFMTLRQARMSHLEAGSKKKAQLTKTHYIAFNRKYYLHPRSFVLATTLEWVRLPGNLAAYVIGRSSWGRRGLIIATATGVHPGFTGCLTLELTNVGEIPIAIKPGDEICQLFIHTSKAWSKGSVDRSQFVGSRKPTLGTIKPSSRWPDLP